MVRQAADGVAGELECEVIISASALWAVTASMTSSAVMSRPSGQGAVELGADAGADVGRIWRLTMRRGFIGLFPGLAGLWRPTGRGKQGTRA
jgi:hypothetical protein